MSAPAPPPSRPFRPPPANAPIAASSKPEPRPAMTGLPPVRTPSPSPVPTSGPRDRVTIRARLDDLRARYERDAPHQHFVTDHTHIVFDDGDCAARLMFIGEAPGADEDRTGVPFVGRAGQLLNKMIAAMGLRREDVYIANVLKTRPPNNATPTSDEIRLCAPYLFEQIAIVRPEVIVTLGLPATRALLESSDSMSRLRGRWYDFTPPGFLTDPIPILPTYHPAFLLRSYTRENREKVWADLRLVMDRLGLLKPGLPTTGDGLESAQGP
ncbi:MAG: uracil-DNA glycosylase [Phycisphaerales bacterium]